MRQVSDKGSALYNMALATGNIISPILGGSLVEAGDRNVPCKWEDVSGDPISDPCDPSECCNPD
jgi:hypothetical protein